MATGPRYSVEFMKSAARELRGLSRDGRDRVWALVEDLRADPRPPGCKALQGRSGFRVRSGDYRVVYTVDDSARAVLIAKVGHRRDIYR